MLGLVALVLSGLPALAIDEGLPHATDANVITPRQILITIATSPTGLQVQVDGTWHTAPYELSCDAGTVHTVNTTPVQFSAPDVRYVFAQWSDGGSTPSHTITCDSPVTLAAMFQTQFMIVVDTNPAGLTVSLDGMSYVAPLAVWCTAGSTHIVFMVVPAPGPSSVRWVFDHWSDGNRSNPRVFVCSGPMHLQAGFRAEFRMAFGTSPAGLSLTVDGSTVTAPQSFWWADGSDHSFAAPSLEDPGNGTRYLFAGWSDGGAQNRTLTVSDPVNLTAAYDAQFRLSLTTPHGSASCDLADCWYAPGATSHFSISPTEVTEGGRRYRFAGWTGDFVGESPNGTLSMDGPKSVTAKWDDLGPASSGLTPMQWLGVGGAAVAGAVGLALALSEPLRVALVIFLLALWTKFRRGTVLDNEKRGMVRGYLAANPGANFTAIRNDLKMATGTLTYHLQVLEHEGILRSWADGRYRRYALSGHPIAEVQPRLTDIELVLLQNLLENPGRTQRDLTLASGLSQPTISYHMGKMASLGVVSVRREGWRKRYFAALRERPGGYRPAAPRPTEGDAPSPATGS